MNSNIRATTVRLIGQDKQQLGIKPLGEALEIARQSNLDLVEIVPLENPPVCRIMDYGKFRFDETKRARGSRRKTANPKLKEMRYRPSIGREDFETKTRQVVKFLNEGHTVQITIVFSGREVSHPESGREILGRITEATREAGTPKPGTRLDGRRMVMVLVPNHKTMPRQER
jgi:translation initiation factor IF-3